MDDAAALIASMRANPEEDTPRLAYADLVEERDQHARAELIRVQVARARLNPRPRLQLESFQPGYEHELGQFVAMVERPSTGLPGGRFVFDALNPNRSGSVFAVGCEGFEDGGSSTHAVVRGRVTGTPCPVRPEADALDAKAAELLLRLPAPTWCPVTFNWHFDPDKFAAQAANPEPWVLVRRGFAEHVRCSWEDWVFWADWFRANHPCERVTLTTPPETRQWSDPKKQMNHFRIKEVPGEESVSEEELTRSYDHGRARIHLAVTRLLARHWSGTTFSIP